MNILGALHAFKIFFLLICQIEISPHIMTSKELK